MAGIGKSDHFAIVINLSCTFSASPGSERYNYHKTDTAILKEEIGHITWDQELAVNDMWVTIKQSIDNAVSRSTPKTCSSGRKGKGWMDRDTLETVKGKHKAFRKWKAKNSENYRHYIKARNRAKAACRRAQKEQERKVANEAKSNPKAFWNYVKSKTKTRTGIADLKKPDGSKTKNDREKADLLNLFF